MKNIFLKASLFCLLLLTFSCAKETKYLDAEGEGSNAHPAMKAKVNGKLVVCEMTSAVLYNETPKVVAFIGSKGTEVFSFDIEDFKGVGTYNLNNGAATYFISQQGNMSSYASTQGSVKITSSTDKLIKGTFEFKCRNTDDNSEKTISEGSFSLNLTTSPINPNPTNPNPTDPSPTDPTTGTNMSAKINGTLLNLEGEGTLMKGTPLGDMMTISGDNDTKSIMLSIMNYKGTGTYTISATSLNSGIYQEGFSSDNIFTSTSGNIVVTSSSATSIKGTFSFTASKNGVTKTVTEGKFDVSVTTVTM